MSRYSIHLDQVSAYGFDWGQLTLTIGPEVNGAQRFSGGIVTVAPGGGHSRHDHPDAQEIILVMASTGAQMVEDDDGTPLTPFVVLSPAGPERALRDLPDFRP